MSLRNYSSLIRAFLLISLPSSVHSQASAFDSTSLSVYKELHSLPFDPQNIADVKDLTIKRDQSILRFAHGTFYFSKRIAGKITGAVFLGEGVFEFSPPDEIERGQVRRFLEKDSLSEKFSAAYLRFSDDTVESLRSQIAIGETSIPKDVAKMHGRITKGLLEDLGFNLSSRMLEDLLKQSNEGLFMAVLQNAESDRQFPNYLIYSCDPLDREEVSVYQYFPHRYDKAFYTVCSFPRFSTATDIDSLQWSPTNKDQVGISDYKMKVELEKNGSVKIAAKILFSPKMANSRSISFTLYHDLKVDSVKNLNGDRLAFIREKKQAGFLVILSEALPLNDEQSLWVYYSGKLLEPAGDHLFLKDKIAWFPRHGYLNPATFDITFQHRSGWQVVSGGKELEHQESQGLVTARWIQTAPSVTSAFAFGSLEASIPETDTAVTVYSTSARSRGKRKEIARQVSKSLHFFKERLHEGAAPNLKVVETPGLLSHGFPGLLLLSTTAFQTSEKGALQSHIGHEVSHQWWGNIVGWRSYHDQWLSEAFAEYSGALLAQHVVEDEETFVEILEGWRNDLLEKGHIGVSLGLRRFGFSKTDLVQSQGLEAGPIWLGLRLGSKFPVDYYVVTYEKGAYVLHMLRLLLHDFDTDSDERFWTMMADFVAAYRGQRATTNDFKRIVEKHVGEPMEWFFDQWIFDVEVPAYFYSYTISNSGDEYWLDLSVRQEEVAPDFKMFIPIGIQLQEKKLTELIWMQGREQPFRLGPFPEKPSKIIFNDFDCVLARVKQR